LVPVRVNLIVKTRLIIKISAGNKIPKTVFLRRRFSVLDLETEAQSQGTGRNARLLLGVPSPLVSDSLCVCSCNRS